MQNFAVETQNQVIFYGLKVKLIDFILQIDILKEKFAS